MRTLALVLAVAACGSDPVDPPQVEEPNPLVGRYEMVRVHSHSPPVLMAYSQDLSGSTTEYWIDSGTLRLTPTGTTIDSMSTRQVVTGDGLSASTSTVHDRRGVWSPLDDDALRLDVLDVPWLALARADTLWVFRTSPLPGPAPIVVGYVLR